MKSILLALSIAMVPSAAYAQGALGLEVVYDTDPEEFGLGVHAALHTDGVVDNSRLGLGARYLIIPTEEIDGLEFSGTFVSFNVDGQYLFYKAFPSLAYGLLGLNVAYVEQSTEIFGIEASADAIGFGLNLGAGFEYRLADTVSAFGEGKIVLPIVDSEDDVDFDSRIVLAGGVRFYFGGSGGGEVDLSDF